jgi:hypothetical protein
MSLIGCDGDHMTRDDVHGSGVPGDPWKLTTPSGSSEFEAVLEVLGLAEVEHSPRNNSMRAI